MNKCGRMIAAFVRVQNMDIYAILFMYKITISIGATHRVRDILPRQA